MNILRVAGLTLWCALLSGLASADVRTIHPTQELTPPSGQTFTAFGHDVAIDGNSLIVLTIFDGGQSALLYGRDASDGQWRFRRTLLGVTGPFQRANVVARNGIAAVQFGTRVWIFEISGGTYVLGRTSAPVRHAGGLAISNNRLLIGGNDCDYDGVIYQKGADGIWAITGRLDDNQGACQPDGLLVELNGDYAILTAPYSSQMTAWRRNGTAVDWVRAGDLELPPDSSVALQPVGLQGSTAVVAGSSQIFRRIGTTWMEYGALVPVDYANGTGNSFEVKFRDGVLLASHSWLNVGHARPYAYLETLPGAFEHVAILDTRYSTTKLDMSGRTVVAATRDWNNVRHVEMFTLPSPLRAPDPFASDFEDRDTSGFTSVSGQFALGTRGSNTVLTRTDTTGLGITLVNGTGWSDYQRVEADITPNYTGGTAWAGVVARYRDADNYYYLAMRGDDTFGIYRRLNGADTLLLESVNSARLPARVALVADGDRLYALINEGGYSGDVRDSAIPSGRAGLATFQARADFDHVYVTATETLAYMDKDWFGYGYDFGRPFTEIGGDWRAIEDEWSTPLGFSQLDTSGDARAIIGVPVANQEIRAVARVDEFASSRQGAWFGLLARYVDAGTFYYVTVRSTGQVQIRKQVGGVISVLASANFVAVPGQDYRFRFRLVHDQLSLFVDGRLVATARDADIASGRYGIATYRAAATWQSVAALQP